MWGKIRRKVWFSNFRTRIFLIIIFIGILVFGHSSSIAGGEPEKGVRVTQLSPYPSLNHDSTSFPLLGAHRSLECAKCHSGGRYRGTPRTCETCHNGQITYGKPTGHLITSQSCMVCHSINAWSPTNFIHDPSTAGRCSNCHNGQMATGKPPNHISTGSQCDACHSTRGWLPATFKHTGITGNCSSCHKNPAQGITGPRNDTLHNLSGLPDCGQCHTNTISFSNWTMNHTGVSPPTACMTCHVPGNNMGAIYKPNGHPVTTQDCGSCHNTTSFNN